jgi:hypothetical protein
MQPLISTSGKHGVKFIRRSDVTPYLRLSIAYTALQAQRENTWGVITTLARTYDISRTFVYLLAASLVVTCEEVFGPSLSPLVYGDTRLPYRYMLSLRLEGRCSIGAISTIMKRFEVELSSVGTISQSVQAIGALLPSTVSWEGDSVKLVVFLSDELFAKRTPILVTVDPQSSVLLRIELADTRQIEDWKRQWECLRDNGIQAVYLVSDEGSGITGAQKEVLADLVWQPDTYHAIAHRLGKCVKSLERAATAADKTVEERWQTLDSARTDPVLDRRIAQYEAACREAARKRDRYEAFWYVYQCLVAELLVFDEDGTLRERQEAEGQMTTALDLLDSLKVTSICGAVKKIRRILPDLLAYFEVAARIVPELMEQVGTSVQESLPFLCLAWQWHKRVVSAKQTEARHASAAQEQEARALAAIPFTGAQDTLSALTEQVYATLDEIVQSSSLVECLNSIIRPYLNTSRNHVTQEFLNVIMFYHNHRRYKAGKRKGHTPMELFTGTSQELDWLDLLFEDIEKTQPNFFTASR